MKTPQIYVLIDPITNDIKYVGKTVSSLSKRLSSHYKDKHHTHKTCWIKSLKDKGLKPIIQNIEFCNEDELNCREIYWISYFKEKYKLTNLTNGGDGLPIGFKHSDETKEKIRKNSLLSNNGKFKKGNVRNLKAIENSKKKILVYNINGEFIQEIIGIKEASILLKINKNNITDCLKNKLSHIRDYRFFYFTENYPLKINKLDNIIVKNRKIKEFENDIFVKEYINAKEAAKILNIKYYILNNILVGKTKYCKKYPNKNWKYSDI